MTNSDSPREHFESPADTLPDHLVHGAIILVLKHGKASVSLIQRHLLIGYSLASRLMDVMVRDNIVGRDRLDDGYRAILLSEDEQADLIQMIRLKQIDPT